MRDLSNSPTESSAVYSSGPSVTQAGRLESLPSWPRLATRTGSLMMPAAWHAGCRQQGPL